MWENVRSISSIAKTQSYQRNLIICVLLYITFYVFGLRLTREKLINVWLKFEMLRRVTKPKHISILPMITVFFYLDCDVNLGLGNYKLSDSSITASSVYNSQYNTSKIRLDRKGWCPLSKTEESWVKIDLLKVGVISDTSSLQEVFYKKIFLEISQNSQENICARVSFLSTGVFLWILRNFWDKFFSQNALDGCFWLEKQSTSTQFSLEKPNETWCLQFTLIWENLHCTKTFLLKYFFII